jgi:uridine kinase
VASVSGPTSSRCSCARGREVIRASTESFHLPRAQRYQRGEFSPEANDHDSFDYDTLRRVLLDPLGPDGDRRYQHAVYDLDADTALPPPVTAAAADAVLLLEGVFLLGPELVGRPGHFADRRRPTGDVCLRGNARFP